MTLKLEKKKKKRQTTTFLYAIPLQTILTLHLSMFVNITLEKNFTFLFLSTDTYQNHVLQLVNICHSCVGSSYGT